MLKKLSLYQFVKHLQQKLKIDNDSVLLLYKIDFPAKTTSNRQPQVTFEPIENLEKEVFYNNNKKATKKSLFYLKVVSNNSKPEYGCAKVFTRINEESYQELQKDEDDLLRFADLQKSSAYKKFEYQRYMFDPECNDDDDLNFTDVVTQVSTKKKKTPSNDKSNESNSQKSRSKDPSPNDEMSNNEDSELALVSSGMTEYFKNYKLIFLKYFDPVHKKFYVIGDLLVPKDATMEYLRELVHHKHQESMELITEKLNEKARLAANNTSNHNHNGDERNGDVDMEVDEDRNNHNDTHALNHNHTVEFPDVSKDSLVIFEETGTCASKPDNDITLLGEVGLTEHVTDGNIFIYTNARDDLDINTLYESILETYKSLRTNTWVELIERDSEFVSQVNTLRKRMAVNTTENNSANR